MADIQDPTSNVTIYDEDGYKAEVTPDNELMVNVGNQITTTDAWETYVRNDQGFAVSYSATIAGKDPTDYLILKNPSGSGMDLLIKYVEFSINAAATISTVMFYKNPTVTADGTGLTEINLHDDTVTGSGQAYSIPTVSSRGTTMASYTIVSSGSSTVNIDRELGIRIEPGKYFLIVVDPEANNTSYNVNVWWAEDTTEA